MTNSTGVPDQPMEALLSAKVAAEKLGVSLRTMRTLIKDEEIPSFMIGRSRKIREEDLQAFIDRRAGTPPREIPPNPVKTALLDLVREGVLDERIRKIAAEEIAKARGRR